MVEKSNTDALKPHSPDDIKESFVLAVLSQVMVGWDIEEHGTHI